MAYLLTTFGLANKEKSSEHSHLNTLQVTVSYYLETERTLLRSIGLCKNHLREWIPKERWPSEEPKYYGEKLHGFHHTTHAIIYLTTDPLFASVSLRHSPMANSFHKKEWMMEESGHSRGRACMAWGLESLILPLLGQEIEQPDSTMALSLLQQSNALISKHYHASQQRLRFSALLTLKYWPEHDEPATPSPLFQQSLDNVRQQKACKVRIKPQRPCLLPPLIKFDLANSLRSDQESLRGRLKPSLPPNSSKSPAPGTDKKVSKQSKNPGIP